MTMVSALSVTFTPLVMLSTRTALLPLRVMLCPLASIVTSSVMTNVLAKRMEPLTPKFMVSAPAFALAEAIAARKEPTPLSFVFVTVSVALGAAAGEESG